VCYKNREFWPQGAAKCSAVRLRAPGAYFFEVVVLAALFVSPDLMPAWCSLSSQAGATVPVSPLSPSAPATRALLTAVTGSRY